MIKKNVNIDIQTGERVLTKHFTNVFDLKENDSSQHVFYYDDERNKCEAIFRQKRIVGIYISPDNLPGLVTKLQEGNKGKDLQIKIDKHGETIEELQKYLSDLTSRLRKLEINKETEAKSVFSEIEKEDPKEEDPDYTSMDDLADDTIKKVNENIEKKKE